MVIDGTVFFRCMENAARTLGENENAINSLNVYPVPDGDTGSNMFRTVSGALSSCKSEVSLSQTARELAKKMLISARGNSGAILSRFFKGFASAVSELHAADESGLADALRSGTDEAYAAVLNPCEGTVLTVMDRTAQRARELCSGQEISGTDVFAELFDAAKDALWDTRELLPVLKEAGVVDAGGLGFLAILHGFCLELSSRNEPFPIGLFCRDLSPVDFSAFGSESFRYAFCVECTVEKSAGFVGEGSCSGLADALADLGDSIVFTETDRLIKLHVHTNEPEEIFSLAGRFGALTARKSEDMALQHTRLTEGSVRKSASEPTKEYGLVFVSAGEGFESIFRDLGADRIVHGGQTMNPSAGDILDAVELTPARQVFVLPGNKNILLSANQAAQLASGRTVTVIPTESLPESIAAGLAFDPSLSPEENLREMSLAAGSVDTVSVTKAVRDATVDGISVSRGEYIGLLNGDLVACAGELADCLSSMEDVFSQAEFINIYYGGSVDREGAKKAAGVIDSLSPDGEIELTFGGQPLYDLLISLE